MSTDPQKKLQALTDDYQKLQTGTAPTLPHPQPRRRQTQTNTVPHPDLQTTISALRKLEAQQQENTGVQREFAALPAAAQPSGAGQIYKLLGPVLLKQDKSEAELAVSGRLDFIAKEIARVEDKIRGVQEQSEKIKMDIYGLQSQMQAGAGAGDGAGGDGGGAAQAV